MAISALGFVFVNVLPQVCRLKSRTRSESLCLESVELTVYPAESHTSDSDNDEHKTHKIDKRAKIQLLVMLLVVESWLNCMGNGLIPAVSSYAFFPYGGRAAVLIVNIGMWANPITAFAAVWLTWRNTLGNRSFVTILIVSALATGLCGFIIWLATPQCNHDRPLQGDPGGIVLMVWFAQVLFHVICC